jgi:hypothetical protein
MRSFDQLTPQDFPNVDPEINSKKFEEWKQAGIAFHRNAPIVVGTYIILALIFFFALKVGGFIPIIIFIAVMPLLRWIVGINFNQLSKELGITNDMINKALKTDSFEASLTKPEVIETPDEVSASNLDSNVEIEQPDNDISEELSSIEVEQEEDIVNDSNKIEKLTLYILIFAGLAIVSAIIIILNALLS